MDIDELLIIDDCKADFVIYKRLLSSVKHNFDAITHIDSIEGALAYINETKPQCCILDYNLPDGNAKQFVQQLHKSVGGAKFPIIVSTGAGDERIAVEMMQLGVQDYLVKGKMTASELLRAIRNAIRTFEMEQKLHFLAHTDPLTGLLNRALFTNRLEHAVKFCDRNQTELSLIYLDLDNFKLINDSYGHDVGDVVLQNVAKKLTESVRETDSVARLGGDEFVIMLHETQSYQGHFVVQKLLSKIPEAIRLDNLTLHISPSIGLVCYPGTADNYKELMKQADEALYKAKHRGRAQYVKFSQEEKSEWQRKVAMMRAIPEAISNRDIKFAYQPILNVTSQEYDMVEALVRWQFNHSLVPALDVVNLILRNDMYLEFHKFMFLEVLTQLKQWQQNKPSLIMSINIPANIVHNKRVLEILYEQLNRLSIPYSSIVLEITETHLMKKSELTMNVLQEIHDKGIQIAIDDFGTGYSSLEYLSDLPCNKLKIDQKFFRDTRNRKKNRAIIQATTTLGHQLDLKVVAEGIETEFGVEESISLGCDYVQGFWYSQPTYPEDDWCAFIRKAKKSGFKTA